MPSAEVFLVRHGETQWNASGRFQGALDSSLTTKGIEQAEALGRRLSLVAPRATAMFVSPLERARQTSRIIRGFGSFPEERVDPNLREVSLGSWDGLTDVDIDACWPGHLQGSTPFDWFFRSPDGESYSEASARAREWFDCATGIIIAVSHGLMGRILRGVYLGLPQAEALQLPVGHDAIWHLADGSITEV